MAMDLDTMLQKIKDKQWALVDIDWDAPGAELIDDDLWAKLKPFMTDLMWIENVGARGLSRVDSASRVPSVTLRWVLCSISGLKISISPRRSDMRVGFGSGCPALR